MNIKATVLPAILLAALALHGQAKSPVAPKAPQLTDAQKLLLTQMELKAVKLQEQSDKLQAQFVQLQKSYCGDGFTLGYVGSNWACGADQPLAKDPSPAPKK